MPTVYRIVQNKARTLDLSGTGAHRAGGRWNSKGTYMIYASENSSLAYLETLVHFDSSLSPTMLFIMEININDSAPVYTFPDSDYPPDWLTTGLLINQEIGDKWMNEAKYLAIKVRSSINTFEYNYLLNPLFPNFIDLVRVIAVNEIGIDGRLVSGS